MGLSLDSDSWGCTGLRLYLSLICQEERRGQRENWVAWAPRGALTHKSRVCDRQLPLSRPQTVVTPSQSLWDVVGRKSPKQELSFSEYFALIFRRKEPTFYCSHIS